MGKASTDDVHKALQMIVDNSKEKSLMWAVNYAKAGLCMTDGRELHVQCLYVLNNMQNWRGEQAKQVRSILKSFCGLRR